MGINFSTQVARSRKIKTARHYGVMFKNGVFTGVWKVVVIDCCLEGLGKTMNILSPGIRKLRNVIQVIS